MSVAMKFLIPVASSRMMILEFLTSARARETREHWNFLMSKRVGLGFF